MSPDFSKPNRGSALSSDHSDYAVLLPCTPDEFGDFVSGLLGKPQTIEKSIFGEFEVTRDAVANTFHLVNQRIDQQNEAPLIQFTARIEYDDNSSVLLNSLQDFGNYILDNGIQMSESATGQADAASASHGAERLLFEITGELIEAGAARLVELRGCAGPT
jgi:hypothetical protein